MIIQLVQTVYMTASLTCGAILNRKIDTKETPKRENVVVNYNETIEPAQSIQTEHYNISNIARDPQNILPIHIKYGKANYNKTWSAMQVNSTAYYMTPRWNDGDSGPEYYIFKSNYNQAANNWYNTSLICLMITPYNVNINTEGKYSIQLRYEPNDYNIPQPYPASMGLSVETYTSTESDWASLIGMQNYAQNLNTLVENYVGPNNAYTYAYNLDEYQLQNTENQYRQITVNLDLTPNTANYIIIKNTIHGTYTSDPYENQNWDVLRDYVYLTATVNSLPGATAITNMYISGTMVIPDGTQEIVDVPGLMFDILGMPFTFISMAFNLTIFPGTPYQLNISNLILSLLAIVIFMWIINKMVKR